MEFTVEFYETALKRSPIRDFLDALNKTDPNDFAAVIAGITKLRNSQYHREPLSKSLSKGLFELRHIGKLNTRVFWFFMEGRRIILAHGIRNKGQDIPKKDLEIARDRMRDWMERNSE